MRSGLVIALLLIGACGGQGRAASPAVVDADMSQEEEPDAAPEPVEDAAHEEPALDAGVTDGEVALDGAQLAPDAAPDAVASKPPLGELLTLGDASVFQSPRPAYGALVGAQAGGQRSYAVESRRDAEPGPLSIPWRSRFRVAAYDGAVATWAFIAEPDDVIGDVVVHPSGDVTLAIEHFSLARDAYELVRLTAAGDVRARAALPVPTTVPDADYGVSDPRPLFRMKSPFADATVAGWVRLIAEGEGLAVAFMSYVDVPAQDPRAMRRALGVARLDWQSNAYVERWARVVEGSHGADPAAWAYDELRWREQAVRPFLARDALRGDLVVGRAWNQSRCEANRSAFDEFPAQECVFGAANVAENERLPLAVTRFDAQGQRLGTRILRPELTTAEQVPFALAARDGKLAVVGALVRTVTQDVKRTYPDANGFVDYDGYIAIYDAEGVQVAEQDFNAGRGDVLAALDWSERGIVAVGSSDWDRWQGGMSISRGASPLFVWLAPDGQANAQRVVPLSDGARHYNLHDVIVRDDAIIGVGFSDAPMTHSADGVGSVARSFGPLRVILSR